MGKGKKGILHGSAINSIYKKSYNVNIFELTKLTLYQGGGRMPSMCVDMGEDECV